MSLFINIVLAIILNIVANWIWEILSKRNKSLDKFIIAVLTVFILVVYNYYGEPSDLVTTEGLESIKSQLRYLNEDKKVQKPIFLYVYPIKFDNVNLDATKILNQKISAIISATDRRDLKLCEAYSLLNDTSILPENFYSNTNVNTIVKITGTLLSLNEVYNAGVMKNVFLSIMTNESKWQVIATVPIIAFGDTSKTTQFPKIHFDNSFDNTDAYFASSPLPRLRFNTVVGENDSNCFSDDECKDLSFRNAISKIHTPDYEMFKKVVVEKEQNRFFTYVTYSSED